MNELENFFFNQDHRLIHKWNHYFEIYERHLKHLRDSKINLLEIGISHGGSLQMWDHYFKGNAMIYAVDINPECKKFESENVRIFIGSQEDKNFLQDLRSLIPHVDVLIDDGGHTMKQQVTTFEALFDLVSENGIYICEDTHTSYWKHFGGGYKKKRSFIEYSKNFIDSIHAWHRKNTKPDHLTETVHSIHYYDSVIVVEKRKMTAPFDVKSGHAYIADKYANTLLVDQNNLK